MKRLRQNQSGASKTMMLLVGAGLVALFGAVMWQVNKPSGTSMASPSPTPAASTHLSPSTSSADGSNSSTTSTPIDPSLVNNKHSAALGGGAAYQDR